MVSSAIWSYLPPLGGIQGQNNSLYYLGEESFAFSSPTIQKGFLMGGIGSFVS